MSDTILQNRKIKFSLFENLTLFFLFLSSLNFVGQYVYMTFFAFAVVLFIKNKDTMVHADVIPMLLFTGSLLIFWRQGHSSTTAMVKTFIYPICYVLGYNFAFNVDSMEKREKSLKAVFFMLALGTWAHLLLNFLINFGTDTGRITYDFWTGKEMNATGQAGFACIMLAYGLAVLFSKTKTLQKMFAVFALVIIFVYNLTLAGRTVIVASAIIAAALFLNYIKEYRLSKKTVRIIFIVAVVIIIALLLFNSNAFGIRDSIFESNLYNRFFGKSSEMEFDEDPRMENKMKYIKLLSTYPFGGGKIRKAIGGSYAHDAYLDTYDEAGVFAFIAIVAIMLGFIIKTLRIIKNKKVSFNIKQLLLAFFIVINIEFFLEPILAGMPWLLACFCIAYGSVSGMYSDLIHNTTGVKND